MRRLARDQWVRLHGTPRVTVLLGGDAGEVFRAWLALGELQGHVHEGPDLDRAIRDACARVSEYPRDIVAVATTRFELDKWRGGRTDRLAAMVDEGVIDLADLPRPAPARSAGTPRSNLAQLDARSAAEASLYEALEATPSTAGRFELNGYLSIRFGDVACEVDLLSRQDGIAIEIDGVHHFADPDRYRRDRKKDLLLQTHGFVVVRLLAEDVMRDVRTSVTAVCQALAYRLEERAR